VVGDAEVFLRLAIFYDDLLKLLVRIHEGAYFLGALFRADLDFALADLAKEAVVNVSEEGDVDRPVVSLL